MKAIYKRELQSYFNSMTGYVFIAVVMFFIGLFFMIINLNMGFPYFAYALSSMIMIFVFAVPVLTMRSMADERRSHTDQMLMTYPVSNTGIVMGKYLAMVTVLAVPMLLSCLCPLVIQMGGSGSFKIDLSAIFAVFCLGSMFIAIGMFISSLTESQIIAAVSTMAVLLVLYLWSSIVGYIPETNVASFVGFCIILAIVVLVVWHLVRSKLAAAITAVVGAGAIVGAYFLAGDSFAGLIKNMLGSFSVMDKISNFTGYYVFDIRGIVLFLSMAALFVFLSVQSLQKKRWS